MDITGTELADTYDQSASGPGDWLTYRGLGGNDTIRMYSGTAAPGAGADTVEHLSSADWWRNLEVAYWDSPAGVVVDLAAGWADDGWGTRDTLIGSFSGAHGSWHDDHFSGSATDNHFVPNGGHDVIDGRAGIDSVGLGWQAGDPTDLSNYVIVVSTDGLLTTVTSKTDKNLRYELSNIERLNYWDGTTIHAFELADFIDPKALAEQGLTGATTQRWNASIAVGSAVTVSYSFVESAPANGSGASGFRSFSPIERQVLRDILTNTGAICGLSFTEVAEVGSAVGQIRLGISAQSNTKGQASMPDVTSSSGGAGDIWMDVESMLALTPGSEGYAALLHELGHALGLRHPRNVDAGDAWAQQWRNADDKTSYSAMSGTASADGLFRADWGPLDVTALQYLYGSKGVNSGDTVYTVGGADAQAQRTLLDTGGTDTLDASASGAGVSIDLVAAHLSSVGLTKEGLTPVENLALALGTDIENAIGSVHDDVLIGNNLANRLTGGLGNDWIDGGAGTDTTVLAGQRASYLVSTGFGKVFVAARDGSSGFDTLLNIERLSFDDGVIALGATALAADVTVAADQGTATSGNLPDPTDQDRAAVSYSKFAEAAHGSVTLSAGGAYVYTPSPLFAGEDRFVYRIADSKGGANIYVAYFTVAPSLDVPTSALNLVGTDAADVMFGSTVGDTFNGAGGNDTLAGRGGNDVLNGGAGIDTAVYSGARASYRLAKSSNGYTVTDTTGADAIDTLEGIERLQFADTHVALDLDGLAGQTAKLLGAVFGATSVANKQFVGIGLSLLDDGMTYEQLATLAVGATGKTQHADIVALLWSNLFGSAPTAEQAAPVVALLDHGLGIGALTVLAADLNLNAVNIDLIGLAQTGIGFVP